MAAYQLSDIRELGYSQLIALFFTFVVYFLTIGVYRLYFSSIAKFPGPKLAALTFWYEFYYDVWPHKFQYLWKIKALHEEYGAIIRINPIHIHINDPSFYDEIHAGGARKRDRCSWFMHARATGPKHNQLLQTMDHDLHRKRRQAMSPYFSKGSIQNLEPFIKKKVDLLILRLNQAYQSDDVVNLSYAYSALTMDVISGYCFGDDMKSLDRKEFGREWLDILHDGIQIRPVGRQFPWLINTMMDLPPKVVMRLMPRIAPLVKFNLELEERIGRILAGEEKLDKNGGPAGKTIFHELKDSNLPSAEKTAGRLSAEASTLLGAGTETTARTLAVTSFYLLENKGVLKRLQDELRNVMPARDTAVSLNTLEQLPYMTAVVNEGLRLSHGVSSRMPRIATQETLQYGEWIIPQGTPVMQSAYLLHTNPEIFPDPFKFSPQRWLDHPKLAKNLFAFGRGSRSCIGMNLAYAEVYMTLAYVLRSFEMEPYETIKERDVETKNDCFIGMTDLKSLGIRVKVLKELD
jgi:cytochrome P450